MKSCVLANASGCPSYVIADERTGQAALVNPQHDFDIYVRLAEENGLQLRYIFVPNVNHDLDYATFALRAGGKIYVFDADEADRGTFNLVRTGDVIEFGQVRLAVQPPVDRGSCMSLLVYDLAVSDRAPQAVLGRELNPSARAVSDTATLHRHVEPSSLNCARISP